MNEVVEKNECPLVRFIAPAFPEINIFTRASKKTTALGLIMVATSANKVWGWRVEVIDENNYRGPRDKQGLPDHAALQRDNPAEVVGFYCGLTSTMERVWELADFYRKAGAFTIAGSWHANYCPEETLKNNIDAVVHGDGELVIQKILSALRNGNSLEDVPGISFLKAGEMKTNPSSTLQTPDLNLMPYPDFGLLRFAKIKIYPIGRIRGCRMNCEFCSVKGEPRWADGQYLFNVVNWLRETRKARKFFVVDDRLEEDLPGTIDFLKLVSLKYGKRLIFTVQIRLETAKNLELLEIMKNAGVKAVCVGYESPIDEDLKAMRKGYLSANMLEWTKILRRYFWVHGMFIFGYPSRDETSFISVKERVKRFKKFIWRASLDSIQVLHPVPLVGTALRERLEKEGRIFPLELVPWSKYDGNYVCFEPEDMSIQEFQEIPLKLMKRFYNPFSFIRIPLKTITFPLDYFVRGWKKWHRAWYRDIIKYGGYLLIQKWLKTQKSNKFLGRLEKYQTSQS